MSKTCEPANPCTVQTVQLTAERWLRESLEPLADDGNRNLRPPEFVFNHQSVFFGRNCLLFFYSNSFLGGDNSNLFDFHPKPWWSCFFQFDWHIICFRWVGSTNHQPAIFRPKVSPVLPFFPLSFPSPSTRWPCSRVMSYQVNFLGSALALRKGGVGNLREPMGTLHFIRKPLGKS